LSESDLSVAVVCSVVAYRSPLRRAAAVRAVTGPRSRITYTPAAHNPNEPGRVPLRTRLVAIPILPFSESPDHPHEAKRRTLAARPPSLCPGRDPSRRAGRARLPVQPLGPGGRPRESL